MMRLKGCFKVAASAVVETGKRRWSGEASELERAKIKADHFYQPTRL